MNAQLRTPQIHRPEDPDPHLAVLLDPSAPVAPVAARAMTNNARSRSRRMVLPAVRLVSGLLVRVLGIIRVFLPKLGTSSKWLHRSIHWGLRTFVRTDANRLILRHFHLGTQVLGFIADNAGVRVPRRPLTPTYLSQLEANVFVEHDINLFNFVIELNQALQANDKTLPTHLALEDLNFDSVTETIELAALPRKWSNVLDLESAIHLYTPVYQWFLSDREFSRAVASLQLDESIGIYIATLIGTAEHLHLINNRHPLVPSRRVDAAHDLVLHGLGTERLHYRLVALKKKANAAKLASAIG